MNRAVYALKAALRSAFSVRFGNRSAMSFRASYNASTACVAGIAVADIAAEAKRLKVLKRRLTAIYDIIHETTGMTTTY